MLPLAGTMRQPENANAVAKAGQPEMFTPRSYGLPASRAPAKDDWLVRWLD